MITQTIDSTTVQYHSDGNAWARRPSINVKVYTRFDSDVRSKLEAALNPSDSAIRAWADRGMGETARERRVVKDAAERFNLDVDTLYEQAFEDLQRQWWDEATEQAKTLGLGPIEQGGRSGGWLEFTDGRDPREMLVQSNDGAAWANEREKALTREGADPTDDDRAEVDDARTMAERDRTTLNEWLAAYRAMAEWCSDSIKAYSADLDRAAVSLALDVAQSAVEPEEVALTADEFTIKAHQAHDVRDDPDDLLSDEHIEVIVKAVWGEVGRQHERTADLLVDVIEQAAGPEIITTIEALEGGAE